MNKPLLLFFMSILMSISGISKDQGVCPSGPFHAPKTLPAKHGPTQPPPNPDAKYAGTVVLGVIVSTTGYVCNVQLIRGFDKTADEQAMQTAREWHFDSARKNGAPVAVELVVPVDFWRNANGELVQSQPGPTKTKPTN
ncbi:MAG TPA: energy transducer TonB [Candidatus Angelobacter sp.]|nr:energy transducer TonB [Candidatus Angelobacter sp.]